jgi:NAD(P)-dependent dehydrogenase (short-subunit alcohol dehydrogenase family)
MRIIVVGGTGTIGKEVADALKKKHEVVTVGRTHGDHHVDIASKDSIRRMFDKLGPFDALVSTAGTAAGGAFPELTDDQFKLSLDNKLMGQVNLVRLGLDKVRDGGSFTLTSGVLAEEPSPKNSLYALVNGAINSFGRAAALDLPRKVRLNVVSPPWVTETLKALGMDLKGGMPAAKVALAFVSSVEGNDTGKVIDARKFA